MGVFELPEAELDVGLGPVGGDHIGYGPVFAVGDQDPFAEDLVFQGGPGPGVDDDGEPALGGGGPGEPAVPDPS